VECSRRERRENGLKGKKSVGKGNEERLFMEGKGVIMGKRGYFPK
jgi:hypothetical protein